MVRVCGREQVVGNVGAEVVPEVSPLGLRRDAADVAEQLLARQHAARVGEALDVVVAAGPVPVRVPLHARVQQDVDVGALAAGPGALAPRVVVEVVAVGRVVAVLATEALG